MNNDELNKAIETVANEILTKKGTSGIYDLAEMLELDCAKCKQCEVATPMINGECLICGTPFTVPNRWENNRIFAQFMEAEMNKGGEFDMFGCMDMGDTFADIDCEDENAQHFFLPEEMRFDTDWNWFMPVVAKLSTQSEEPEELDELRAYLLSGYFTGAFDEALELINNK